VVTRLSCREHPANEFDPTRFTLVFEFAVTLITLYGQAGEQRRQGDLGRVSLAMLFFPSYSSPPLLGRGKRRKHSVGYGRG